MEATTTTQHRARTVVGRRRLYTSCVTSRMNPGGKLTNQRQRHHGDVAQLFLYTEKMCGVVIVLIGFPSVFDDRELLQITSTNIWSTFFRQFLFLYLVNFN